MMRPGLSHSLESSQLAKLIADTSLEHYNRLPSGWGKPQSSREWTVFCAIVATEQSVSSSAAQAWVVSCATGTKCTSLSAAVQNLPQSSSQQEYRGRIVKDCHAEILTRRGFKRVLWAEIVHFLKQYPNCAEPLDRSLLTAHVKQQLDGDLILHFELKSTIQLHLYISDSPCGDASIYSLNDQHDKCVNFTGAKVILPSSHSLDLSILTPLQRLHSLGEQEMHCIARENNCQLVSAVRLKSCRSDIPPNLRTQSLSCSDKIARWTVLGLQGSGPLTAFIPTPIALGSIVVSQDPRCCTRTISNQISQLDALQRAILHRALDVNHLLNVNNHTPPIPNIFITDSTFPFGKAMKETCVMVSQPNEQLHISESKKRKRIPFDQSTNEIISPSSSMNHKLSPCGLCFNWQMVSTKVLTANTIDKKSVEVMVGAKGILQGKHPKNEQDVIRCTSRLSRWSFRENMLDSFMVLNRTNLILRSQVIVHPDLSSLSYQQLKHNCSLKEAREIRHRVLFNKEGPLGGWWTAENENDFASYDV